MSNTTSETEVWSVLSKEDFGKQLKQLEQVYAKPRLQRRLGLQVTDYARKDLDTRIRITDGRVELLQKAGDWNNQERQEIMLELAPDAKVIARLYGMLVRLIEKGDVQQTAIQVENYIFDTPEAEVKLTRHLGKEEAYSFEVELPKSGDLTTICQSLGFQPDFSYKDEVYWKEYNQRVNLDLSKVSEAELVALVQKYL